jgi:hypothetical protein
MALWLEVVFPDTVLDPVAAPAALTVCPEGVWMVAAPAARPVVVAPEVVTAVAEAPVTVADCPGDR